ncbi:L,D-transpeptidase [Enterovirga rhinocerotis]|uniref:Lipoprotein-anchoring transpeptidase ErfK/SrfK n=1 Tax=Enterovirga rhinocerotis TaxID=1339210 RepID=A0A4R7C7M9_9HYPH|nr:L,D-transpeptidase [Enterovirga rhinocerotis]TDR94654.1 lipoprotein-anchoring transpeptidase ErfK/SrfK [Enterovirga rhinocerotis]
MVMITRRSFATGIAGAALATTARADVEIPPDYHLYYGPEIEDHGKIFKTTNREKLERIWLRQLVEYRSDEPPGSVVIDTQNHFLYVIFENQTALRYGVGVGREGFKWYGRATIDRRAMWPTWTPPPEMLKRKPELPRFMEGGDSNPMGARALYLYRDKGDTGFRIHGTNEPWSIGHDGSSGCIRLLNEDAIDLYGRCPIGTKVLVLKHLGSRDA